jgi:hypothetical protein
MIFIPRNDCTNQVLNLVDPPKGIKPNGSKWTFKRETNMKDNV